MSSSSGSLTHGRGAHLCSATSSPEEEEEETLGPEARPGEGRESGGGGGSGLRRDNCCPCGPPGVQVPRDKASNLVPALILRMDRTHPALLTGGNFLVSH